MLVKIVNSFHKKEAKIQLSGDQLEDVVKRSFNWSELVSKEVLRRTLNKLCGAKQSGCTCHSHIVLPENVR